MPSSTITQGMDRAPARAMLKAVGFSDEDLAKPIVGVANTWTEIGPCNYHLRELAVKIKEGIRAAGGTPMEFNTVSVSDGITMGTEGMKTSLISREVIADSIELVARGNMFDAIVAISGCDKTIPGTVMALARLDVPSLMLYGGAILPGQYEGRDLTVQDVFEAVGACAAGRITKEQLGDIENKACPGAGACGGQFTANTMATAFEVLGISPMGSAMVPAVSPEKMQVAFDCGRLVMDLLRKNITPRQIITRKSLENAIASVAATGGSTNSVLHLLAVAHEAGVDLAIEDFDAISARTPLLANLKPWGRFVANDVYRAGGVGVIAKRLMDAGLLHAGEMTATGRTIGEEASAAKETDARQPAGSQRRPGDPEGQPGARGLRDEDRGQEDDVVPRRRARVQSRGKRHDRRAAPADQGGGCRGNPLRRPQGWPWYARNAGSDGRPGRPGTRRIGRADDGRALLGCHPRHHGGPCRSGSGRWRPHCRHSRRRFDRIRRPPAATDPGSSRG